MSDSSGMRMDPETNLDSEGRMPDDVLGEAGSSTDDGIESGESMAGSEELPGDEDLAASDPMSTSEARSTGLTEPMTPPD